MTFRQHVLTHAQWIAQGGWEPADYEAEPDHNVIVCTTDIDVCDEDGTVIHEAGSVLWASWAPPDVDIAKRLNPDHPVVS